MKKSSIIFTIVAMLLFWCVACTPADINDSGSGDSSVPVEESAEDEDITSEDSSVTAAGGVNEDGIRSYGGSEEDKFTSIIQSSDGGYVAVGFSESSDGDISGNHGGNYTSDYIIHDFVIAKFDTEGNKTWIKNYGGSRSDEFCSVIQTSDGGYVATGISGSSDGDLPGNKGGDDFVIAKFDAMGDKMWIKNYGGSDEDSFSSIIQASDGGYVAAGWSISSDGDLPGGKNYGNFVVAKFDDEGNKLWIKRYDEQGGGNFESIIQTSDGGYAAAGFGGNFNFIIAKFDAEGNVEWIKNYGGSDASFNSIIQTSDGDYVAAGGYSKSLGGASPGKGDLIIARFGATGDEKWIKNYGGSDSDSFNSIVQASDGGYMAAGWSWSSDGDLSENHNGLVDFIIAKFDESGDKTWIRSFGEGTFESIVQTSDGGYAAAGIFMAEERSDGDFAIAKFDADGNIQ
jgi:hypothetical protein